MFFFAAKITIIFLSAKKMLKNHFFLNKIQIMAATQQAVWRKRGCNF